MNLAWLTLLLCATTIISTIPPKLQENGLPIRTAEGDTGKILMVVAYCPTLFTGGGALVSVDLTTGNWTVQTKFKWPSEIQLDGCGGSAMDSPSYLLDRSSSSIYFDFINDFGALVKLNYNTGSSSLVHPSDDFFTGYENMALLSSTSIVGLSATVTEDGFCDDGCFETTFMRTTDGKLTSVGLLPYKALMDNSHYLDIPNKLLYVQASYPLTPEAYCSSDETELCLIAIDLNTGKYTTKISNWTVYKFADAQESSGVLCWMEGFDDLCKNPYDNFLFSWVSLSTSTATPIACIPQGTVDQEGPDISGFALDNSLLVTASGDGDAGEAQVLVFNTKTAAPVINNKLPGLGTDGLKSADGLYWVWAVSFV